MEGTLIPAYAINSAVSHIPILGTIFTGGEKGGGVFSAIYTYRGDAATAQPSVNPLAALAPGFTRRIFDIFKSKPPQEASTPETPAREPEAKPGEDKSPSG